MKHTLSYFSGVLYRDFVCSTSEQLDALGLHRGSLPFLLYLGKHPGCTPTELTKALHMDWGHTQRSLDRLEQAGFLSRRKEGRSYRLTLTDSGAQAVALCRQSFHDWDDRILGDLPLEQRSLLLKTMEALAAGCGRQPHV